MDKKVFWLINQYSSTPEVGIGGRSYYLGKELSDQGHQVYLINSSFNHLLRENKNQKADYSITSISSNYHIVSIKTPKYESAHDKNRIYNWFLFSYKLRGIYKLGITPPDVIIYSSPSLIGFLGAKYLSKKLQVPLVFEVRDIWPLSLIELGGVSYKHPFIKFLSWIEKKAYRESDFVISNLEYAFKHMQNQGLDISKFHCLPNGFSIKEMNARQELDLETVKLIPKNKFIVGYTGTIGVANATNDLVKAAKILKDTHDIHFVLVGNGQEKDELIKWSRDNELSNVTFIEAIPKIQVQSMINYFNVCFIGSQNKKIYRFGVSPNKIPEYLYSGKPIIFAYSGAGDPIKKANAGITIKAGSPHAISKSILEIYHLSEDQSLKLGQNGRTEALLNYEYGMLAKKLYSIIFEN